MDSYPLAKALHFFLTKPTTVAVIMATKKTNRITSLMLLRFQNTLANGTEVPKAKGFSRLRAALLLRTGYIHGLFGCRKTQQEEYARHAGWMRLE